MIRFILLFLGITYLSFYSANAAESLVYTPKDQTITYCSEIKKCDIYNVPDELVEEFSNSELKWEIFADTNVYLLTTPKYNSSVNVCYSIYQVENRVVSKTPVNILFDSENKSRQLCIYRFPEKDRLLNRYRDGSMWHEELYQYIDGIYRLVLVDRCLDCGLSFRTYYNGSQPDKIIVSDDVLYENRHPVSANVIISKAYLYEKPELEAKSKMYLIQGDSVLLLDYVTTVDQFEEAQHWYLVSYPRPQKEPVTRWILADNIKLLENLMMLKRNAN